jgi:probable HAF family extracellular repeat protein
MRGGQALGTSRTIDASRTVRALALSMLLALAACAGGTDPPPPSQEPTAGSERTDPPAGAPPDISGHRILDLGTLPGMTDMHPMAINRSGQVVGHASVGATTRAFLWDGSRIRDLGMLPGAYGSQATAISDNGLVVGNTTAGAFLWRADAGMLPLPGDLTGGSFAAYGVNDSGTVAGSSYGYAALWQTDLGVFAYAGMGRHEQVNAIDDAGVAVGHAWWFPEGRLPALWREDTGLTLLGPLPAVAGCEAPYRCVTGEAVAINASGQVAGNLRVTAGIDGVASATPSTAYSHQPRRAFRWTPSGGMTLLGALPDGPDSTARGIDDEGRVYGSLGGQATVWIDGVAMRLDELVAEAEPTGGIRLQEAIGSDDSGRMLVSAHLPGSGQRAVLLVPGDGRRAGVSAPAPGSLVDDQ